MNENWVMAATQDLYDAHCEAVDREMDACDCDGSPSRHASTCAVVQDEPTPDESIDYSDPLAGFIPPF